MVIVVIFLIHPFMKWFGLVGGQLACLVAVLPGFIFLGGSHTFLDRCSSRAYGETLPVFAVMSLVVIATGSGLCLSPTLDRPLRKMLLGIMGCLIAYALGAAVYLPNGLRVKVWPPQLETRLLVCNANGGIDLKCGRNLLTEIFA
jgi:hypothetical protein